jgi:predicted transcriptional regulator
MRIPEPSAIKNLRKQIGVNQADLAKAAGVSQSLIARIESGSVDPSYTKMKQIFIALDKLGKGKTLVAKDVMNKKIIFIPSNRSLKEAASLMRKHEVSQLPVVDSNFVVGSISEKNILDGFANKDDIEDLAGTRVRDIMENSFPQIDKTSPFSVLSVLLEYNNAVLVVEKGRPIGIITRSDVLRLLYK